MAYITNTVIVGNEWTLVVTGVAMLQFNSNMYMAVTSGGLPLDNVGFTMDKGEKYVNASGTAQIYAKLATVEPNTIPSVRVLKDVV